MLLGPSLPSIPFLDSSVGNYLILRGYVGSLTPRQQTRNGMG